VRVRVRVGVRIRVRLRVRVRVRVRVRDRVRVRVRVRVRFRVRVRVTSLARDLPRLLVRRPVRPGELDHQLRLARLRRLQLGTGPLLEVVSSE
jgi:hypothetical protein